MATILSRGDGPLNTCINQELNEKWTWTNNNNEHKLQVIYLVNFVVMIKVKKDLQNCISYVPYIQIKIKAQNGQFGIFLLKVDCLSHKNGGFHIYPDISVLGPVLVRVTVQ